MDKIELSIDPEGLPDWGVWEAVRELIQNWNDNKEDKWWNYSEENSVLTFINSSTVLPRKCLLVGNSTKRSDTNSIGRHGDGLKSALAVILREGLTVNIVNGDYAWNPSIEYSETYDTDVLVIEETGVDFPRGEFIVTVSLPPQCWEEVQEKCLLLRDYPTNVHQTSRGVILKDPEYIGKIFCGGIYVSTMDNLEYGYDFKPSILKLDRDRKSVDSFDVKWTTKDMWTETVEDENSADAVAELLYSGSADLQYLNHGYVEPKLEKSILKIYDQKFPDKMLVANREDSLDINKEHGNVSVYLGNDAFTNIVVSSDKYQSKSFEFSSSSPVEKLEDWKEKWEENMCHDMLSELESIIEKLN